MALLDPKSLDPNRPLIDQLPPEIRRGLEDLTADQVDAERDSMGGRAEYGAPNLHPIETADLTAGRGEPARMNDVSSVRDQFLQMTRGREGHAAFEPVFRGEVDEPGRPMTMSDVEQFWAGQGENTMMASAAPQEPEGTVIPGIPEEMLGPTGRVFIHPNGRDYSTELGAVVGVPGQPGRFAATPLLVPGQTGIADLLAGRRATPDQLSRAVQYLQGRLERGETVSTFDSPEAAVQAEKARHDIRERQLEPLVRPHLTQDWRLDYQDRFGTDPERLNVTEAEGKRELGQNWYVDPKVGVPFLGRENPKPRRNWRLVFSDQDLQKAWDERGEKGFPLRVNRTDLASSEWPRILEAARTAQYEHPDTKIDLLRHLGPDAAPARPRWTVVPHPSGSGFTVAPGDFGGNVGAEWGVAQWQEASSRVKRLASSGASFPFYRTKDEAWNAVRDHLQSLEDVDRTENRLAPSMSAAGVSDFNIGVWPTDEQVAAERTKVRAMMRKMRVDNPRLYERLPLLHEEADRPEPESAPAPP